jgi:hypothetical protein
VELLRRRRPSKRSYDLSDPLDRAAFRCLQVYVSCEETLGLLAGAPRPEGAPQLVFPAWRSPASLEDQIRHLAAWHRAELSLPPPDRWRLAVGALRAMFAAPGAGPDDEFAVFPGFFDAGKDYDPPPGPLAPVATESPADLFWDGLAPVSALIREGLGPLVNQSEAARRLGLTPRGVALRIEAKDIRRVRVGRRVLVPVADLRRDAKKRTTPRSGASLQAGGRTLPTGIDLRELGTAELRDLGTSVMAELSRRSGGETS